MTYNSYSDEVRYMITKTGDPCLFPDLNIPKSTANYWIQKGLTEERNISPEYISLFKRIELLEKNLKKEKELRHLLEKVKKIAPLNKETEKVIDPHKRKQIMSAIKDTLKHASIVECLKIIGLSKATYYRWTSEFSPKLNQYGYVLRKNANQLTNEEIFKLRYFLTSKKFLHFPIHSLHYYALRTQELICSLQTWYRYTKLLGITRWNRIKNKSSSYQYGEGIRAKYPNEIWHIDVTQYKLQNGKKYYLQAVIDNYSRYVLAWKLTDNIGALATLKILKEAHKKVLTLTGEIGLVMDAGTENVNRKVNKYLLSNNFKRLIAQVDIEFSNSLVEALFRSLKNNYLYHHTVNTFPQLKYRIDYYLNQHNQVIPHSSLKGATPEEILKNRWSEKKEIELKSLVQKRAKLRREENKNSDMLIMQAA